MTTEEQAAHMMRWMEGRNMDTDTKIACLEFAVEVFRVAEEVKKENENG